MPHNSGYGGEVERAVFIICNCGLGTLVGAPNLVPVENGAVDAPYLKGQLEFALRNTDTVLVGITAGDVLEVTYRRNGEALYSRAGLAGVALREVIGSIAAVLVRVAELDAAPVKKASKKAA
jgi:hypothetical protein